MTKFIRFAFCSFIAVVAADLTAAARPNVIVIMADDQGTVDLGCYGSKDLLTPNADALAAKGVQFTQFYSGAPVCSPSRACLLTGRYPVRAGVPTNCASQNGAKGALPATEVTMAEMFKAAGYATAHIGKWHIGYTPEAMPNAQGFDHSFGHMGGCIDNYSHFFFWSGPNVHDLHRNGKEVFYDGQYFPQLMLEEATAFMKAHLDQPFFIYYALNTPHYPYQGEPKWLERFKDLPYPRNLYAAFVASQDERLGKLIATLDELHLRENTVLIFQSDNGHSTEERAHFGGGSAGNLRGAKFSMLEGGIRVPAILSMPGRIPENEVRNQVAHASDWMPTLAELCDVPLPDVPLDGRSLMPVVESAAAPSAHPVIHWQVGDGPNAEWAVREGDWKLIGKSRDTSKGGAGVTQERIQMLLVNIAKDPEETTDLSAQHPEIVARLKGLHETYLK